jgi:NodT family efflux transporter outer membrane factor (OMF) lipoprotein
MDVYESAFLKIFTNSSNIMNKKSLTFLLIAIGLMQVIIGCAKVGPDYVRPAPAVPASWRTDQGTNASQPDPRNLAEWWTTLNDPLLTRLINQAVSKNLDLKQAKARLLQARARHNISVAGLWPNLNATGSATKSRSSEGRGTGTESNLYSIGFDAGWELDFFGGGQRSVEAAQAQIEASQEDLRDVLVSLISEVALNYIEVRTHQTRLQIAIKNLNAQQETFSLTQARFQSGLTTELAVQQARSLMAGTQAQIPTLYSGLNEAINRLNVLLGLHPGSLNDELQIQGPIPVAPLSIAIGIPADILRRRPDVRKAERQLAAQTAQIGVATAELYPTFRLSGSVGLDALASSKLFNTGSHTYSFGPSLNLPIFDAGAIRANIQLQSSLQEETLARYEATLLLALEEVENTLVASVREQERHQALQESAEAARQTAVLADIQYQAGLTKFNEVLDARRSLLSYQDQQAQSEGTMAANLVRLYKALGGGWTTLIPEPITPNKKEQQNNGNTNITD